MNSYDDIDALKSKVGQGELEFQTFSDKSVVVTSAWPLLNELLHRRDTLHQSQVSARASQASMTTPAAAPAPNRVAPQVSPAADIAEPLAEAQSTSVASDKATDLSSILKKVSK
ncbi:hypothetical protein JYB87_09045 [Shewanella avicenniae]|uniref:Cellulose biosynthesis protein BcsO n=1 Tax=Shewanella avicenniae TaxID=2814294 RepID=A0ABX7QWB1_9GAMM|nr:hypothetical protein [Shewanella avicenniae]QSX35317.1 hypothetical protein JYB87_09045 [Shewanella avicenniae]